MNAREARDIVKKWEESEGCPPDQDRNLGYADGYLASLEGPEVKALVKALKYSIKYHCGYPDSKPDKNCKAPECKISSRSEKALSQFREAVK